MKGSHSASELQELLKDFIKKFVLCPECENPETMLRAMKKDVLEHCKACGYDGKVKHHKLNSYIIKDSAKGKSNSTVKKISKNRSRISKIHEVSDIQVDENNHEESYETNDEDWSVDVSKEAVRLRRRELSQCVRQLCLKPSIEK